MNNIFKKLSSLILGLTLSIGIAASFGSKKMMESRAEESAIISAAYKEYSGWTWSGTKTDKSSYYLIGNGTSLTSPSGVFEHTPSDQNLIFSIVGGTFGGAQYSGYVIQLLDKNNNSLISKSGNVSGSSQAGNNSCSISISDIDSSKIDKIKFSGTSGNGTSTGVRFTSISLTYHYYASGSNKNLVDIVVSGDMNAKSYIEGTDFIPDGLVATGYYDDETNDNITNLVEWAFNPTTATYGQTSISVVASLNNVSSDSYIISGVNVTKATQYELVTSTNQLIAGSRYILSSGTSSSVAVSGKYNGGNNIPSVSSIIGKDGKLTNNGSFGGFVLGGASGAWTFQEAAAGDYFNQYWYAAGGSSSNNLKTRDLNSNDDSIWTISLDNENVATIKCTNSSTTKNWIRKNSTSDLFSCYGSGQSDIYLFKEISTEPSFAISPSNIFLHLYGDDAEVEFVTDNITSPSFGIVSYSASDIANVSITNNKATISALAVGSITVTIKENTSNLIADLVITVDRIPHSAVLIDAELESGGSSTSKFKSLSSLLTIYDEGGTSDSNKIALKDCSVNWSSTDSDVVGFTDARIFGKKVGEVTVTATISVPDGESIVKTCTVTVTDDYPYSGSWNISGEPTTKEYNAGDIFNPTGIVATYKTYFHHENSDSVKTLEDLYDLLYTTSSTGANKASEYHFTSDDVSENQTIYIYYENEQIGSISNIVVNARDVALTSITFEEGSADTVVRGGEYILTPVFNPDGTTDARTLSWSASSAEQGVSIKEVNGVGVVTVAANAVVGAEVTITATSTVRTGVSAQFGITVGLENQKVHTEQSAEQWVKVTSAPSDWSGEYLIGYEISANQSKLFNGVDSPSDYVIGTIDNGKIVKTDSMVSFEISSCDNGYSIKALGGDKKSNYIFGKSGSNSIQYNNETAVANTLSFNDDGTVTILSNGTSLRFNSTSGDSNDRFRYYKTTTNTSEYHNPCLYLKSDGTAEKDIDVTLNLYNAVRNAEACFECSSSGTISFASGKSWSDVSAAFTTILSSGTQDEKDILKYGVSKATAGNEIEQFLSKYDYIVGKYGSKTYNDFLNRNPSVLASSRNIGFRIFDKDDSSTPIVLLISVISITSLAGLYFLTKKRKHN